MDKIKLLDCTLRDGGYINDWQFGQDHIISIFERLVDAGVDIIEIGFLDQRRVFDPDRTIMPDTVSADRIYGKLKKQNALIVGMIDYGTCSAEQIAPAGESCLDGIRVIFKKHLRREAMAFCAELKKLGYIVFAQLVSVTSYRDGEMLDLADLANEVRPYAVSIVDTYGLMHQNNLRHYFELLDRHLDPGIGIGYHGHNNFQMGYANCIEFLKDSSGRGRTVIVDGTLSGMGKSAGNTPVELIAMHLNQQYGKDYRIPQLLEAIDASVSPFQAIPAWGYDLRYFISAFNDCHPNYVTWLINKRTLSIQSVSEILSGLENDKKLLYDEKYIDSLYYEYLNVEINDSDAINELRRLLHDRTVLLMGPGRNIHLQQDRIREFIRMRDPVMISVNFLPGDFQADYLFLSSSRRYIQLASFLCGSEEVPVIATSNLSERNGEFAYRLNFASLQCGEAEFRDNPFLMLLKVMMRIGLEEVWLAGFDGYAEEDHPNYVDYRMEYHYSPQKSGEINRAVSDVLRDFSRKIRMRFLTDTLYQY